MESLPSWLMVGAAGMIAVLAIALVLRRSWGNFPSRITSPDELSQPSASRWEQAPAASDPTRWGSAFDVVPAEPSQPGASRWEQATTRPDVAGWGGFDVSATDQAAAPPRWGGFGVPPTAPTEAGTSNFSLTPAYTNPDGQVGGALPLQAPMLRQVAESMLAQGHPTARHILRQGDQLYFNLDGIQDMRARRTTYDLVTRLNRGEGLDMRTIITLMRTGFGAG